MPLTDGTVATHFGDGKMSMLGVVVCLLRQPGAFLGGFLCDVAGSYDIVW